MKILCLTPIKHLNGVYEHLESFGDVSYAPELEKEHFYSLDMSDYYIIFCNPNKQQYLLNEEVLGEFNGTILTASTGLNHIDVEYCNEKGIKVLSLTKDMLLLQDLPSTSELAFGLMLSLLRRIPQSQKHVSEYNWDYTQFVGRQIKDLNIGIIGYGRLGKMMYDFCRAFGANVVVYDPYKINKEMPLEYLITHCDVISLHVHVTDETKYMLNKHSLGLEKISTFGSVKGDCYIINTSRGEIVNEADIVEGLKSGRIT